MTTKEPAAILSALDMQIAIQALPCVHPGTVPQLQTAYEAGHRHALRQAGEFVVERLTATPAPVPGPILTWEQRVEADPNFIGVRSKEHLFKYVMDEVRDLRAALAAVPGQSEPMLCEFGNQDDFDEAHGDWERQRRYAVVGAQEYNGNTVSYMYSKAKNYGNALLECCKLLGGTGDVRDRIKALLAERDALMAPVSGATSDDSFVSTTLSELARRGASPAGLSLAAQLLGVGPCSVCGYRKLHCRCAAQPAPVSGATSDEHQTYRALAEENRTLTAKMNEYRDKLTESEEARHELVRLLNEEAGSRLSWLAQPQFAMPPPLSSHRPGQVRHIRTPPCWTSCWNGRLSSARSRQAQQARQAINLWSRTKTRTIKPFPARALPTTPSVRLSRLQWSALLVMLAPHPTLRNEHA